VFGARYEQNTATDARLHFRYVVVWSQIKSVVHFATIQTKKAKMIRCKLFATNLGPVDSGFIEGDDAVIVMADTEKVDAAMQRSVQYYVNEPKVRTQAVNLEKGLFEAPLVYARDGAIHWVEGFHQVTAAKNAGLKVIPLSTAARMANELKTLVGTDDKETANHTYSFADCRDVVVHY
jgi:hypothetical protein